MKIKLLIKKFKTMKAHQAPMFILACLFLLNCGNKAENNPLQSETQVQNATSEPANSNDPSNKTQASGITGKWNLALEAYDNNRNFILDPEERSKGFPNKYYYQFNEDGSCLIHQMKLKGHYVLSEKNGRKVITNYFDEAEQKGQKEAQYTIISVNKDELVLLETTGDHTFWIFKRV
jgi:hypothetical protein